jgi:ATP cone domain
MKVVKYSGDVVEFDISKLEKSLAKSGASQLVVENIVSEIQNQLYDGIPTKKIYKIAFDLLKKSSSSHAARYNLRDAIQLLGPDGFFFEKFVAQLFIAENHTAATNLVLQGKCVSHEVDVLVKKAEEIAMIECKFHGGREGVSDVKVPMYILSRFNDLKDKKHTIFSHTDIISKCWIVTNKRFTSDAISFGNCVGISLLSWDYPQLNNLRNKIDNLQLYPVTCLTTLSIAEKKKLLFLDVILVSEITTNSYCLERIGLSPFRIKNVLKEVSELCKYL